MRPPALTRSRLIAVFVVFAGWTILALLFTPQHWAISREAPEAPHWTRLLRGNLAMFWTWAALTPAILWFGRRFPLERPRLAGHLLLYLVTGFVFSLTHIAVVRMVNPVLTGSPIRPWLDYLVAYGATGVLISWGILAGSQALTYFRRYQDRELRLVEADLQSLKTQLHPHFLFNTLNAIAELIHHDTTRAERTVTQLSDLLRTALTRNKADEVSLKQELDFLSNYVAIQQTLLQERLIVRWRVDDDALDAMVPAMLLQPIVENAIQHGLGPVSSGGTLDIAARRDGSRLVLEVMDDGRGLDPGASGRKAGIGISNTRGRLRHMYGDAQRFDIARREGGGVAVTIAIPFRSGFGGSGVPGGEND